MNFLPILLFWTGVVTCVFSNAIPSGGDKNACPPPENVAPCTCFKSVDTQKITAKCDNFTNAYELKAVFDRNPDWELQDVWIDKAVMSFLPAKMLEEAHFQRLNVSSTSLVTLFDTTPITTPELNLYLFDVKILRGFDWRDIANSTLLELGAFNMRFRSFGKDFKKHIPKVLQRLWFENTGLISITNQAFSELHKLEMLVLKRGSLKKVSRDMFPRPWKVTYWDLSYQKIAALPKDIFTDLPDLQFFLFEGNLLTTISEKIFIKHQVFYILDDNPINCNCNIKWAIEKIESVYLHGECAEPKSLKGKELKHLTADDFSFCH